MVPAATRQQARAELAGREGETSTLLRSLGRECEAAEARAAALQQGEADLEEREKKLQLARCFGPFSGCRQLQALSGLVPAFICSAHSRRADLSAAAVQVWGGIRILLRCCFLLQWAQAIVERERMLRKFARELQRVSRERRATVTACGVTASGVPPV